jgi:hypothetical protein
MEKHGKRTGRLNQLGAPRPVTLLNHILTGQNINSALEL